MTFRAAIVLFSYRRPQLTTDALHRLLIESSDVPIFVSIDGTKSDTTDEDKRLRRMTIEAVEMMAQWSNRIIPVVWSDGDGLTAHAIRIMEKVFLDYEVVISLEEDNFILREGLDFLLQNSLSGIQATMATAYSSFAHPQSTLEYRATAFPEQWSTSLNRAQFEAFQRLVFRPVFSLEIIRQTALRALDSNFLANIAGAYWNRLFEAAARSKSHGDALMQYAAWESGQLIRAPLVPLVRDLGFYHQGGLHVRRHKPAEVQIHALYALDSGDGFICRTCERADLWLRISGLRHTLKSRVNPRNLR